MANSVDLDEMPHSAASHLGLNCLLRPLCPNTYGKYGIFSRKLPASLAQSDAPLTGDQEIAGSTPSLVWQHSFVDIDHEIFSVVILSQYMYFSQPMFMAYVRSITVHIALDKSGTSNKYSQHVFVEKLEKKYQHFLVEKSVLCRVML